ncbi:hypothetical protein LCGC14_1815640 [marine sediment metagenome]|uniref:Uncharacterized protein n=1 Tax=marine sediment metagenome TaxID=412755 RepID=A0A0F9GKK0_9ZZZZ
MTLCTLQETCERYTNGTKRKPHHMRMTVVCIKYKDKCIDLRDIQQGDACLISKGGKK